MIQLSKFTHNTEIGKFFWNDNGLHTSINGKLENATVEKIELSHIHGLIDLIKSCNGKEHLTMGVAKSTLAVCLQKHRVTDEDDFIARSDKYLKPPSKKYQALMVIDGDDVALLEDIICDAVPEISNVDFVSTSSSSSMIYSVDNDSCIRGEMSTHIYIAIDDAKQIPRVLDILHKRCIIAGYDVSDVTKAGGFKEKSPVDRALSVPSQPIYLHANCSSGVYQKKRIEKHFGSVGVLKAGDIHELTAEQNRTYKRIIAEKRESLKSAMIAQRAIWIANQPSRISATVALEHNILDGDFILDTSQGKIAIKDLHESHHGISCRDPFDDGTGSVTQAMIFNNDGHWFVNSHAHGGEKYRCIDASKAGFTASMPNNNIVATQDQNGISTIAEIQPRMKYEEVVDIKTGETETVVTFAINELIDSSEFDPSYIDGNLKPISKIQNFQKIIEFYGIKLCSNEISGEVEYHGLDQFTSHNENTNMMLVEDQCRVAKMPTTSVPTYINSVAEHNKYNPVELIVKKNRWNGKDHIAELFSTLNVISDDPNVEFKLFKKWLCGAIRLPLRLTKSFAYVLVLQALRGGEGKTEWFKRLCPNPDLFSSMNIATDNKDDLLEAFTCWIVELGEIDSTFKKSDMKALMSMLSKDRDKIRSPYERKKVIRPRRTVFCGSVNEERYLRDDSGNRRFWTIRVGDVDYNHNVDIEQMWIQVYETLVLDNKFEHWLNREENIQIVERNEENFKAIHFIVPYLELYFNREPMGDKMRFINASMLCDMMNQRPNQSNVMAIGKWLKIKGYEKSTKRIGGQPLKGYMIPLFSDL